MKTKRSFALLLALALVLALLPAPALAAEECHLVIQLEPSGAGIIVTGGGAHPVGAPIVISAAANEGWLFDRWDYDYYLGTIIIEDPSEPTTTALCETPRTYIITAVFKQAHTVTVAGGTADKDSAAEGDTVKLTANVPDGQAFVQWASSDVSSFNPPDSAVTEFAMPDKNVAVTAVCAPILIELANDRWMFTGNPITPDEMKVSLDGVDLSLQRDVDYRVDFRDNMDVGLAAKVIVTMSDDRGGQSATATFAIDPASISGATVTAPEQEADGTEQKPDPIVTWNGKELKKDKDYEIVGYDNNVEPGLATVTVRGKGNFKGTASGTFRIKEPPAHTVTATADPADGGTVTAEPASAPKGREVELTATPNQGYRFKEWQVVKGGVTVTDDTFTMGDEDVEIKAIFEAVTYAVTVTADPADGGTVTAEPASAPKGQEVTLTAAPAEGYAFKEWKVLKGGVTVTNDKFTMGDEDVEIQAVFEKIEYTVTKGANGSYRLKSGKTLSVTVSRNVDDDATESHLMGVTIGGKTLAKGTDYTTAKGSVVITIKGSALDKLTVGKHPLTVTFDDGSAATEIQILAAYDDVTGTGDNSRMFLWLGLTVCGLMGLGGIYLTRRKWTEG